MSEGVSSASFARMSDGVQLPKPTALGQEESCRSARPRHPLALHAVLHKRLNGVQYCARDGGVVLKRERELRQD